MTIWHEFIQFTNPTMHLLHIPKCTIQNRNVHWMVHYEISGRCAVGFVRKVYCNIPMGPTLSDNYSLYIMTWHGNTFRIIEPLNGESTGHLWMFPLLFVRRHCKGCQSSHLTMALLPAELPWISIHYAVRRLTAISREVSKVRDQALKL